jgi:predicted secreted protein
MTIRTGWCCTWLASLAGVLVYGAWPAPEPAAHAAASGGVDYFAFVKPTAFAPAAASTAGGAAVVTGGTDTAAGGTDAAPAGNSPTPGFMPARLAAIESAVQALRRQGADEQAVYRLRTSALPAATAAQLAEREQAETAWQRRVQAYRAERDRLAASGNAAADGDASALATLAQLRAQRFAPDEQARLDASLPPSQPLLRRD